MKVEQIKCSVHQNTLQNYSNFFILSPHYIKKCYILCNFSRKQVCMAFNMIFLLNLQSEFEIIGREPTVYRYNIKIHGSCETFAQCGNIESESSETPAQSRTNELGRCETFAQVCSREVPRPSIGGRNMESETLNSFIQFREYSRKPPNPSRSLESAVGKLRLTHSG